MKVGDIFKSTWGYEQTNVDFYVVTRITPKMVELQECGSKRVGGMTSWASDKVVPDPDEVLGGKFMRRVKTYKSPITGGVEVCVSIDSVASASLMKDVTEATDRSWWH